VMDLEEVGQFVRLAADCAVGEHQRILCMKSNVILSPGKL
jgi:hypothetical protein